MTSAKDITAERKSTHGDWDEGAGITTSVMDRLRQGSRWNDLTPGMKEAVHMIVHKIHRIVTGNPATLDHWDDIGGYAELVSRRLRDLASGGTIAGSAVTLEVESRQVPPTVADHLVKNHSALLRPSLLGLKHRGKPPLGSRPVAPASKTKGKQPRKGKAHTRPAKAAKRGLPNPRGGKI